MLSVSSVLDVKPSPNIVLSLLGVYFGETIPPIDSFSIVTVSCDELGKVSLSRAKEVPYEKSIEKERIELKIIL